MKKNYAVRLSRIYKYYGIPSEIHKQGQIHEEEYVFNHSEYKDAMESYNQHCIDSASNIAMQGVFSSTFTIQLLDHEGTNPNKSSSEKRRIMFQLTMSNV